MGAPLSVLGTAFVASGYDISYVLAAITITAVIFMRYIDMQQFEKMFHSRMTEKIETIRHWENRYILGTISVSAALSAIASYAIWEGPTSLPTVICLCLQFGSLISIVGRNFGSRRNVRILAVINGLPLCTAYFAAGIHTGNYIYSAAGLLLIPSVLVTDNFATFIRHILISSIFAEKKANVVNSQFEAAVANLPIGMVMIDAENRIVTINQAAKNIIGIPNMRVADAYEGHPVDILLEDVRRFGRYKRLEFIQFRNSIFSLIEGTERACEMNVKDGASFT